MLAEVGRVVDDLIQHLPWNRAKVACWLVAGSPAPPVVHAAIQFNIYPIAPDLYRMWADMSDSGIKQVPFLTDTMSRVTLRVDPAMSAVEVAAIFAETRSRLLLQKQRLRPLEPRAAALVGFVLDQPEPIDEGTPWERWRVAWNAQVQENWRYESARPKQNFVRAVKSALSRLTYVGWLADEATHPDRSVEERRDR